MYVRKLYGNTSFSIRNKVEFSALLFCDEVKRKKKKRKRKWSIILNTALFSRKHENK